jgi:glycosyltransferase AglD
MWINLNERNIIRVVTMLNILVPVYDEEGAVGEKSGIIGEYLRRSFKADYRLIFVDDASTDGTLDIIKGVAIKDGAVSVRHFSNGPSRRENLALAMAESGDDDVVVMMDLDLSADINRLNELVGYVAAGYDIAIGSRYMGVKPKRTLKRLAISSFFNALTRLIFRSGVRDHQCGFKAFRGAALKSLVREAGYDASFTRGWFWDAEMLIRAQRNGMRIKEFGIPWQEGPTSSFNPGRELKILLYMVKFRLRLWERRR